MKVYKISLQLLFLIMVFCAFNLSAEKFINNFNFVDKNNFQFRSPTERQIEYETADRIKFTLNLTGTPTSHYEFWTDIVAGEERGFFGYQAAKQGYRIFQDIIKIVFEEVLDFEIKKDFYFLRIPLDPSLSELPAASNFLSLYPYIDDAIPQQRDQIISMNYTLFGNYGNFSQCTVCYFTQNHSWFKIDYAGKLSYLFRELGLPVNEISSLFEVGSEIENFDTGVIFQFFDDSHFKSSMYNPYALLDLLAYPALGAGTLDRQVKVPLSQLYQSTAPTRFDSNTGQLRLIMNTSTTLNPYSELTIRRFDLIDPAIVDKYETALRQRIRSLSRDPILVDLFKKKIKAVWHVE